MKNSPLKDVLKGIIVRLEKEGKDKDIEILSAWEKVLGEKIAKHTKLVSLKAGRLVAIVSDSSRLYELTNKRREIIKEINKILKKKKIKEIRFKIGDL